MTSSEDKRVLVRMPQELADRLAEIADREHRSFNAQVVYMLEQATSREDSPPKKQADSRAA